MAVGVAVFMKSNRPIRHCWWFCKMSDDLLKIIRHIVWWSQNFFLSNQIEISDDFFSNVWWFGSNHQTACLMIRKTFCEHRYGTFPSWQQPLKWQWVWSIFRLATTLTMTSGMVYFYAGNNPYNGSGYGLFSGWQQPLQWQWVWSISRLATTPTMAVGMVYFQAGNNPYNGSGYGLFSGWYQTGRASRNFFRPQSMIWGSISAALNCMRKRAHGVHELDALPNPIIEVRIPGLSAIINTLAPDRCSRNFKNVVIKHIHSFISWVLPWKLLSCEWHRTQWQ